jgi:autophagy-related protein 33
LASISSLSLITAFTLASPRGRHPYLLWTALVSFIGGQGVEYWFNGFSRFPSWGLRSRSSTNRRVAAVRGPSPLPSDDSGYIEVESDSSDDQQVNGEKVELEMTRERKVQKVRSWIAGIGFAMGIVGIWGDGA